MVETMTVEERANAIWELRKFWWLNSDKSLKQIEQHLRDQIEDCAKVVDQQENQLMTTAEEVQQQSGLKSINRAAATQLRFAALLHKETGEKIRALAAPTEEGKEIER